MHCAQVPGEPRQNFSVPEPEQAAPEPQRQPRFVHVLARFGSQGVPHAAHWAALVATHAAIPPVSQQSWFPAQGVESTGLHAPHSPFWLPLRTHASLPPGLAAQSASASPVTALASQATQAFATQSGFFAFPVQSLSDVHSTQCPLETLQTGVAARPVH